MSDKESKEKDLTRYNYLREQFYVTQDTVSEIGRSIEKLLDSSEEGKREDENKQIMVLLVHILTCEEYLLKLRHEAVESYDLLQIIGLK